MNHFNWGSHKNFHCPNSWFLHLFLRSVLRTLGFLMVGKQVVENRPGSVLLRFFSIQIRFPEHLILLMLSLKPTVLAPETKKRLFLGKTSVTSTVSHGLPFKYIIVILRYVNLHETSFPTVPEPTFYDDV